MSRGQDVSEQRNELPEGWVWVRLADVASIGSTQLLPKRTPEQRFNYLALENIESGTGRILNFSPSLGRDIGSNKFIFKVGDVLYGKLRPYLRKATVAEFEGVSATDLIPLRSLGLVVPSYLQRYLLSPQVLDYVHPLMAGIKMPRLRSGDLHAMPVPLAPLPEQRRIVAKIEALFEQSRTARQALDRIPPLLKNFRQSILASAFRGDLTRDWREQHPDVEPASALLERIRAERCRQWGQVPHTKGKDPSKLKYEEAPPVDSASLPDLPEGWVWCRAGEFAEVQGGIQKTPARRPVKNSFPYLRVANVLRGQLDLSQIHHFELLDGELEKWCLHPGDVLVVEGNGSLSEIGRCALWRGEISECVHQNHIIRVRCYSGITPPYFHWFLNSTQGCDIVTRVASSTSGLYTLSVSKVQRIIVPMAPALEQQQVMSRIEALFDVADAIESSVEEARRRADQLDQSILAKAFHGELVPQDPDDEPVSVLPHRIRAAGEKGSLGKMVFG